MGFMRAASYIWTGLFWLIVYSFQLWSRGLVAIPEYHVTRDICSPCGDGDPKEDRIRLGSQNPL